ncbi:carbohydrate kinase family protein [Kitasatospora purpeofusca]|uniref:carbohydrate kinase family protein n=1 Tax=Kitasatospora purpeofusca TaxID=67352 RepID=UPI0035D7CEC9
MTDVVDLACFSYLATARLMTVDQYPAADTGTEVHDVTRSLAGDGPITALTAAGLGLTCALVANRVGTDTAGALLLDRLDGAGVVHRLAKRIDGSTPEITVVIDRQGTRTWFAHLAQATNELPTADLTWITKSRAAYIDCYRAITGAAVLAIETASLAGVPVILNLGSDPVHPAIERAAGAAEVIAVQTGLPEQDVDRAEVTADALFRQFQPLAAVVTTGRYGAVARTSTSCHRAPAGQVPVAASPHTHGAGAAFSAAFAAAYLAGHDISSCLRAACTAGTAHCLIPFPRLPQGARS